MAYEYNELNEKLAKYIETGIHSFHNGSDVVSQDGIAQINKMLREVGLPTIPGEVSIKLIGNEFEQSGIPPLKLGENILRAHDVSLTKLDKDNRPLGTRLEMIQKATATPADVVHFDITRVLDWPNGGYTFRTGSSCWWSADSGNNRYRDSVSMGTAQGNGFGIRLFYPVSQIPAKSAKYMEESNRRWYDGKFADRGRVWAIPVPLGYVVFNWYDRSGEYQDQQFAQLLANLLTTETNEQWATIKMPTTGVNSMYLNTNNGVMVYNVKDEKAARALGQIRLSEHVPVIEAPLSCTRCRERFPASGWTKESLKNTRKPMCIKCASEPLDSKKDVMAQAEFIQWDADFNNRAGHLIDLGWGDTRLCAITETVHYVNSMIDISGVQRIEPGLTRQVYPTGSLCFVGVFNYYFMYNNEGGIVRRSDRNMRRLPVSDVLPGRVTELKQVFGRTVGLIHKKMTINPRLLYSSAMFTKIDKLDMVMRMSRRNQLWCNVDWAEEMK